MKPLIVLDLNGTLCLSQHSRHQSIPPDFKARVKNIYIRPYCQEFIDFLFDNFRVAVWSSNSKENTEATVEGLFGRRKRDLDFIWGRNMCIAKDYGDYSSLKPLKLLLNREQTLLDVTIIDDTPEKIIDVQITRNYYAITTYDAVNKNDVGLLEAKKWLQKMYKLKSNVRR